MTINKSNKSLCRYMYKTNILEKDKVSINKSCKAFGFLDGYFDEITYESNFEQNDENKANYEKGYIEGVNKRLSTDSKVLLEEKKTWVIKLAIYDGENSIEQRNFSRNFKDLYLNNYYKSKYTSPKNIEKYMYTNEVIRGNSEISKEQCYVFGYLNGYFDEITYDSSVLNTEEDYMYDLGYNEGTKQRNLNSKKAKIEKLKWIIKLADYDAKNNIEDRIFSIDAMETYNIHYEDFKDVQEIGDKSLLMLNPEDLYNGNYKEQISEALSDEEYFRFRHKKLSKQNTRKYFN